MDWARVEGELGVSLPEDYKRVCEALGPDADERPGQRHRERCGREQHGLAADMLKVEELEAALPAMTPWRVTAGRSVDWAALEAALGTALPSDFRSLAEEYPVLVIDDFLMVSVPTPGAEAPWASGRREDRILQDLYEMGDTEGYVPFPPVA
jgi:hypothetical protein